MTVEVDVRVPEIDLPRLGGLRPLAEALLAPFAEEFIGETVVLNARNMTVGTVSYADGLISALKEYGATKVLLVGATDEFAGLVEQSAETHGLDAFVVSAESELPRTRVLGGLQPA